MACPAGKYYEYVPIHINTAKKDYGYLVKINENLEYNISAGLNYSFTKSIESGISVSFYSEDKNKITQLNSLKLNVYSKNFGNLPKIDPMEIAPMVPRHHAEKFAIFRLDLPKKTIKKNRIINDTIYVELNRRNILTLIKKN